MTQFLRDATDAALRDPFDRHVRLFHERFGAGGEVRCFFAPGRVNLMGAHLDYNGGPVIPTAINRGTFIAARATRERRVRMSSTLAAQHVEFELSPDLPPRSGRWFDYPLGAFAEVYQAARRDERASAASGMDILFGGNLAVGAGLSSSASICVGTAVCVDALWSLGCTRLDLVQAALRAERNFVGVRCGIMDPYAVGLARTDHLLWLDCRDGTSDYIPLDTQRYSIAVADTLVRRELAQGAFNERVHECSVAFSILRQHQPDATCLRDIRLPTLEAHASELTPVVAKRARHVIHEVARTFAARDALLRKDPAGLGEGMIRAHESLRDLFDVSVPELDQLVESAVACEGVLGSRLTGAGFGGCTVILLERGSEDELRGRLEADFARRFGRQPSVEFFAGDSGPRELPGPWTVAGS